MGETLRLFWKNFIHFTFCGIYLAYSVCSLLIKCQANIGLALMLPSVNFNKNTPIRFCYLLTWVGLCFPWNKTILFTVKMANDHLSQAVLDTFICHTPTVLTNAQTVVSGVEQNQGWNQTWFRLHKHILACEHDLHFCSSYTVLLFLYCFVFVQWDRIPALTMFNKCLI